MLSLGFIQNIGTPGLIILLIAVLIIFGPKNLPALGRALGRSLREFKDAASKIGEAVSDDDADDEKPRESLEADRKGGAAPKAEKVRTGSDS